MSRSSPGLAAHPAAGTGTHPTAEEVWAGTALLDRLPGGYVALNLNGRITLVTPAAAELVDAEPERLLGSLPWEALPWMDVPMSRTATVRR